MLACSSPPNPQVKNNKETPRETEVQRWLSPFGEPKEGPGVFLLSKLGLYHLLTSLLNLAPWRRFPPSLQSHASAPQLGNCQASTSSCHLPLLSGLACSTVFPGNPSHLSITDTLLRQQECLAPYAQTCLMHSCERPAPSSKLALSPRCRAVLGVS